MENQLMIIAGVVLSLLLAYIPPLQARYNNLNSPAKAGIMVLVMAVVAIGGYVAGCYTPWAIVECSEAGIWQLIEMFVLGVIVNQTTYQVAVRPGKAKSGQ